MKALYIVIAVIASMILFVPSFDSSASADDDMVLVDYGNGMCEWYYPMSTNVTIGKVLSDLLADDMTVSEGRLVGINGYDERVLANGQVCGWFLYYWDETEWFGQECDLTAEYTGGSIALGYYTSFFTLPSVTPVHMDAWTQFRSDSGSSGSGTSAGPKNVSLPIEWEYTADTGGIYSNILYADGYLYYMSGGSSASVGRVQSSYTYCVDPENKTVVWSFMNHNTLGYETSTPCIVGDMLIVTSANWHVYCLDRYTGEAFAELLPRGYAPYTEAANVTEYDKTGSDSGMSGAMTSVYDSGALYFNTSDGTLRCYTVGKVVGFEKVWEYRAEGEHTCYYTAPSVVHLSDRTVVLSGDYEGYLNCIDTATGEPLWASKRVDPSISAGVSSITPCSDGRVLVSVNSNSRGSMNLVDVQTGEVLLRKNLQSSAPVVVGGTFYCYIGKSDEYLDPMVEGSRRSVEQGYYAIDVDTFRYVWFNGTGAYSKSGIVHSGGYLYAMDYYPKSSWPDGGCVRCYDPNTGDMVWRVLLENGSQYSMVSPTVVDGKIYTANDSGTVYVLSEDSGKDPHSKELERKNELAHWSWIAVIVAGILGLIVTVYTYRRV
ncbi:MAG: PQQ-binding-like beta-propeller repeat protein [archaeon]|nr:PQQ-binding-like beta-propeller repeat protein [archaeon]